MQVRLAIFCLGLFVTAPLFAQDILVGFLEDLPGTFEGEPNLRGVRAVFRKVFAIDKYNRGGYLLFYDDFRKHASFEFSFH